ncbi:hypothetical protein DW195_00775 [Collinsella sp. AM17-1]|nr:hypothetical protein DW195_00775 [Collinsella sp. AM17-1]
MIKRHVRSDNLPFVNHLYTRMHFFAGEGTCSLDVAQFYIATFHGFYVCGEAKMLMYGKEASNRKQEIDRQHYTIPNQRPKDKHCGKI